MRITPPPQQTISASLAILTSTMMFRILLNLGRNAGAAGATKLAIKIWRASHLAIFDISDNGSGIPWHLCPTLFSPFKSR